MIKADESTMPGSTWNKTADREPVFILRAQDKLASSTVRCWVLLARLVGVKPRKIHEAAELASQMDRWQDQKTPD